MQYLGNMTATYYSNKTNTNVFPNPYIMWATTATWIDFSDPFGNKRSNRVEADKYGFINWEE